MFRCDVCDRPATTHEVERVGDERIPHHLCDQHAADRARTHPIRTAFKMSWGDWLDRLHARFTDAKDWPVHVRIPARMVPGPPAACETCGEPATDRDLLLAEDGTLVEDRPVCSRHGGRPAHLTIIHGSMNDWPAVCERCSGRATVRIHAIVNGNRVTRHLCDDHARCEGVASSPG